MPELSMTEQIVGNSYTLMKSQKVYINYMHKCVSVSLFASET